MKLRSGVLKLPALVMLIINVGKLSKPLLVWGKINMKCYGAAVFNAYLLVMVNAR